MSSGRSEIEVDATKVEPEQKPLLPDASLSKFSAHHFSPAPNGVDSNLLLLLHGLGDSDTAFFNLGKTLQKTLPQTAVLTLQAPHLVPFLQGPHWMWWQSFDRFGELLTAPNPTETVNSLIALLDHLITHCGWPSASIHMFGFGQGATLALETLVSWTRAHTIPLGSIVSVSGELISHPTTAPSSTPILQIARSATPLKLEDTRWASHRKTSTALQVHRLPLTPQGDDEGMLRNNEWDAVMQFWSERLRNRSTWEREGKVVQVGG